MKFYKLAAAAAVVLVSSTVNAAVVNVYDNRVDFRAASGTTAVTEDFNAEVVGTSFNDGAILDLGGFTLERTGTVAFGGEIQDGAGAFNIDGTNFANVQTATFLGDLIITFVEPIFAFGLDLYDFNNEFSAGDPTLRTTIWLNGEIGGVPFSAGVPLTAEPDVSLSRFLGFTSDTSFTSISFVPNAGPNGDAFGIDNIEYGVSTVPVPAAAWLFGSAILGMFGFSRRKTHA